MCLYPGCFCLQSCWTSCRQGLKTQLAPTNSMFSGLKMQTRSVCCFPDRKGFALGGIEGRRSISRLVETCLVAGAL